MDLSPHPGGRMVDQQYPERGTGGLSSVDGRLRFTGAAGQALSRIYRMAAVKVTGRNESLLETKNGGRHRGHGAQTAGTRSTGREERTHPRGGIAVAGRR